MVLKCVPSNSNLEFTYIDGPWRKYTADMIPHAFFRDILAFDERRVAYILYTRLGMDRIQLG